MLLLKHHSLIITSSFRNFIISCYSLIWLLSNIVSSEGFSSMVPENSKSESSPSSVFIVGEDLLRMFYKLLYLRFCDSSDQ